MKIKEWWIKNKQIGKYAFVVASWIPVGIGLSEYIGSIAFISGSSMRPTLNPDTNLFRRDLVTVNKFNCKNRVKRGDIVMARSPQDSGKIIVKRVKYVGGDTITPTNRVVPPNHVYLVGDNIHSIDSATYGPVSINLVVGIVGHVILPLYRFGTKLS